MIVIAGELDVGGRGGKIVLYATKFSGAVEPGPLFLHGEVMFVISYLETFLLDT